MVSDYAEFGYAPLGERARELSDDSFRVAREQAKREESLEQAWPNVRIESVAVTDAPEGSIGIGEPFEVRATVNLGGLDPADVAVELYVGQSNDAEDLVDPVVVPLTRTSENSDGAVEYKGGYMPTGAGRFQYGVRVRPAIEDPTELAHLGLVQWA
jgi:starch phosphorylase